MATLVFDNAILLVKGYDLSGDHNQIALSYGVETLDNTVFGAATRTFKGGLKTASLTSRGYVQYGANLVDEVLFNRVGVDDEVVTLFPDSVTIGSTDAGSGFAMKSGGSAYNVSARVGELLPFDYTAVGRGIEA